MKLCHSVIEQTGIWLELLLCGSLVQGLDLKLDGFEVVLQLDRQVLLAVVQLLHVGPVKESSGNDCPSSLNDKLLFDVSIDFMICGGTLKAGASTFFFSTPFRQTYIFQTLSGLIWRTRGLGPLLWHREHSQFRLGSVRLGILYLKHACRKNVRLKMSGQLLH